MRELLAAEPNPDESPVSSDSVAEPSTEGDSVLHNSKSGNLSVSRATQTENSINSNQQIYPNKKDETLHPQAPS